MQSGYSGSGITVAVINDYPPSTADISSYLTQFNIHRTGTYTVENVNGGSPQNDQSGLFESTLDVETIEALAPGANVIYYATPDLSAPSLVDAYEQVLSDGRAQVVDMSYGGCETAVGASGEDSLFAQGASAGIAYVAASGDLGDECFEAYGSQIGVNFPASDPSVIGVGGTQTATTGCQMGDIKSQQAFNDRCSSSGVQEATGGGVSSVFSVPSYQAAIGLSGRRNVPDVAMPAVFDSIYLQGTWILANGTSWSAPQIAAMMAGLYQYCNGPLQQPEEIFYQAFEQKAYADFLAVTSGNNQYGSDATYYSANGGFSDVTGIGVPSGMQVAQSVCPGRQPASLARASLVSGATPSPAKSPAPMKVPSVRGLTDLGRRTAGNTVRVVIVLRASSTTANDEQTVSAALTAAGFRIAKTYPNHLVIDADAPSNVVASYFQTDIHDFAQGRFGNRYANVTPLVVPSAIAPYVQSVISTNLVTAVPQD